MKNNYTRTHDIDWFYCISGFPVHVASAGGELPKEIQNLKMLHNLQIEIDKLPEIFDVELNREYIRDTIIKTDYSYFTPDLLPENNDLDNQLEKYNLNLEEKLYYNTFIHFALRGFYTFDRSLTEENNEVYFMVARPIINSYEAINDLTRSLIDIKVPSIQTDRIKLDSIIGQLTNIPLTEIIDTEV